MPCLPTGLPEQHFGVVSQEVSRISEVELQRGHKGGLSAFDAGRESLARLSDATGDMVAEARAEVDQAHAGRGPA